MDDGCLDMDRAFHVGCRGSVKSPDVLREDREQGWTTIGLYGFLIMNWSKKRPVKKLGMILHIYSIN